MFEKIAMNSNGLKTVSHGILLIICISVQVVLLLTTADFYILKC